MTMIVSGIWVLLCVWLLWLHVRASHLKPKKNDDRVVLALMVLDKQQNAMREIHQHNIFLTKKLADMIDVTEQEEFHEVLKEPQVKSEAASWPADGIYPFGKFAEYYEEQKPTLPASSVVMFKKLNEFTKLTEEELGYDHPLAIKLKALLQ